MNGRTDRTVAHRARKIKPKPARFQTIELAQGLVVMIEEVQTPNYLANEILNVFDSSNI